MKNKPPTSRQLIKFGIVALIGLIMPRSMAKTKKLDGTLEQKPPASDSRGTEQFTDHQ